MRRRISVSVAVIVLLCVTSATHGQPIRIDDFERGPITDTSNGQLIDSLADGGTMMAGQATVLSAHNAFAKRYVGVELLSGTSAVATLKPDQADTADDALRFAVNPEATARFSVGYDTGAVNFLAGGNDRLAITLGGDAASGLLRVGLGSGIDGAFRTVELQTSPLIGPGVYAFDLNAFVGRDPAYPAQTILARVQGLEFEFASVAGGTSGRTFTVDDVQLVPEPNLACVALAVCWAARGRRLY